MTSARLLTPLKIDVRWELAFFDFISPASGAEVFRPSPPPVDLMIIDGRVCQTKNCSRHPPTLGEQDAGNEVGHLHGSVPQLPWGVQHLPRSCRGQHSYSPGISTSRPFLPLDPILVSSSFTFLSIFSLLLSYTPFSQSLKFLLFLSYLAPLLPTLLLPRLIFSNPLSLPPPNLTLLSYPPFCRC